MSDVSPTRSAVLELQDERRAMHEGYVFLDEKCLLLAGEMLRQLGAHDRLHERLQALQADAHAALAAAVARHGLHGLEIYPPTDLSAATVRIRARSLMGVRLQDASLDVGDGHADDAVDASPEQMRRPIGATDQHTQLTGPLE